MYLLKYFFILVFKYLNLGLIAKNNKLIYRLILKNLNKVVRKKNMNIRKNLTLNSELSPILSPNSNFSINFMSPHDFKLMNLKNPLQNITNIQENTTINSAEKYFDESSKLQNDNISEINNEKNNKKKSIKIEDVSFEEYKQILDQNKEDSKKKNDQQVFKPVSKNSEKYSKKKIDLPTFGNANQNNNKEPDFENNTPKNTFSYSLSDLSKYSKKEESSTLERNKDGFKS